MLDMNCRQTLHLTTPPISLLVEQMSDRRLSLPPSYSCTDMDQPVVAAPESPSHQSQQFMNSAGNLSYGSLISNDLLSAGVSLQELADALTMPRIAQAYKLVRTRAAAASNASLDNVFSNSPSGSPRASFDKAPVIFAKRCTNDGTSISSPRSINVGPEAPFNPSNYSASSPNSCSPQTVMSAPLLEPCSASGSNAGKYCFGLARSLPLADGQEVCLLEYAVEAVLLQRLSQTYENLQDSSSSNTMEGSFSYLMLNALCVAASEDIIEEEK